MDPDPEPDFLTPALAHCNALAGHLPYPNSHLPSSIFYGESLAVTFAYSTHAYTDPDGYSCPLAYFDT
jgi:hypothetical protein